MRREEECEAESIGRGGRYGCRCQKCSKGEYEQAERECEDR